MNDNTMNRKALPGPAALHMPLQAAPIDRTESPGALAGTPGVEADGWFGKLVKWGLPKVLGAIT